MSPIYPYCTNYVLVTMSITWSGSTVMHFLSARPPIFYSEIGWLLHRRPSIDDLIIHFILYFLSKTW